MNTDSFNVLNNILLNFNRTGEKDIIIPDGITAIGKDAFKGCAIDSVTIPPSVTQIGDRAFEDCRFLTKVTFHEGLKIIGNHAFLGTHINEINFPDSLESIGEFAFARGPFNSPSQGFLPHSIRIPRNVNHIGTGAFNDCSYLNAITVHKDNVCFSDYNGGLYNKNKTVLLWKSLEECQIKICDLPDSVVKIDSSAFSYKSFTIIKDKKSYCGDILRNAYKNNSVIVFVGENYCE